MDLVLPGSALWLPGTDGEGSRVHREGKQTHTYVNRIICGRSQDAQGRSINWILLEIIGSDLYVFIYTYIYLCVYVYKYIIYVYIYILYIYWLHRGIYWLHRVSIRYIGVSTGK